jgi:hypothetical protein
MRKFMGDQVAPRIGAFLIFAPGEGNVVSQGEGPSLKAAAGPVGLGIGVNPHIPEVHSEMAFHPVLEGVRQWAAALLEALDREIAPTRRGDRGL